MGGDKMAKNGQKCFEPEAFQTPKKANIGTKLSNSNKKLSQNQINPFFRQLPHLDLIFQT